MNDAIQRALDTERTIDITTVGRHSGRPRRIEMWFHQVGGQVYITGSPGTRDWYANVLANPGFTFHLKQSVSADLAARAVPITDRTAKREILEVITERVNSSRTLEDWLDASPLIRVEFA